MNRQQIDQQLDYLRRALTQLNQEILYLEGQQLMTTQLRRARLEAELQRMEYLRYFGQVPLAVSPMPVGFDAMQSVQ